METFYPLIQRHDTTDSFYNLVFTPNGKVVFNLRIHALYLNNLKCLDLSCIFSKTDTLSYRKYYVPQS